MKAVLGLLLLVVIATVSVDADPDQSLTIGKVGLGDKLLDQGTVSKSAQKDEVRRAVYHYVLNGRPLSFISCIKIIDKWQNGTNGLLTSIGGGVGTKEVTLAFRSKEGSGLHYEIETWGS